jgi:hypothetical protein
VINSTFLFHETAIPISSSRVCLQIRGWLQSWRSVFHNTATSPVDFSAGTGGNCGYSCRWLDLSN